MLDYIMDTLCTPKSAMSSVFLTPPFSTEKYQDLAVDCAKEPLTLPSFLNLTPERTEDHDRVDILYLLSGPFPQLSRSILAHLKPSDLSTCLLVSKSWRSAVVSDRSFVDSIRNYKIERQRKQENTYMKQLDDISFLPPYTPRLPLGALTINSSSSLSTLLRPLPITALSRPVEAMRPCPQCNSPAKSVEKHRSMCNVCHFDFCTECFKPTHTKESCNVTAISPRKRQTIIACGSKSKKRLRRL